MIDINGHTMHQEEVRVSRANNDGGYIHDEEYQTMWVCDKCDETEPIIKNEGDNPGEE